MGTNTAPSKNTGAHGRTGYDTNDDTTPLSGESGHLPLRCPGDEIGFPSPDPGRLADRCLLRLPGRQSYIIWVSGSAQHGPVQSESSAMPADNCLWHNEEERLFPARPESASGDPKKFCRAGRVLVWDVCVLTRQAASKSQVLQKQILSVAKDAKGCPEPQANKSNMVAKLQQMRFSPALQCCRFQSTELWRGKVGQSIPCPACVDPRRVETLRLFQIKPVRR